ncbi:E3 ubiquitin-protein ligase TRIM32-like [Branchiostoma floridae]|uniref:E3 ubiquitin-protein ligase TRIM32-like n=1 Tax=Branchiostoma floridae TaxID=7739 RepID=A0A9J7N8Q7_BRAFL|nr:E3 ubiquitin-protein ligase TRIM32-like [Branchiostoma floridae]
MEESSQTVDPDGFYSTTSGTYEEAQPVVARNVPFAHTVRTETATAPEDTCSTPSGVYEKAQLVKPSNVPTNKTIVLRAETAAASEECYSTPSGIYEEPQSVKPSNISTNQIVTLREETVAASEDVYSTSSGVYEDPELVVMRDVVPGQAGRGGTSVTGRNRSIEQVADRTGSSADPSDEEPAPHDRIRPFLSHRMGVCLVITCVAVAAMLFGIFIENTTEEDNLQSVTFGGRGSGPGQFARPTGVVVSSTNEIFVADHDNHRVQVYSMEGAYLRHFPTTMPGTVGQMLSPEDIAIDNNDNLWLVGTMVLVGDFVVQYSRYGQGLSTFEIPRDTSFHGIAVDLRNGHVIVTSQTSGKVMIFQPDGSLVRTFGGQYSEVSRYVAVNIDGNILMSWSRFIHVYSETGQFLFSFTGPGSRHMNAMGICTDSSGHVLVADRQHKRVSMFTSSGQFARHVATGLKMVRYVAVGTEGQLVVIDIGDNTVTVYPSY